MARIAVLYDTTEGQTARIAEAVRQTVANAGNDASIADVRNLPDGFQLDQFDGLILGASIHVGKHSRQITDFVTRHLPALNTLPTAFLSVSLSAAGKSDRQQADARRCLDGFLEETGWSPQASTTVAGALRYREYGFFKRLIMKWIAGREGGDTDTSRNYEYTNWEQLQEFTQRFLQQLGEVS